MKQNNRTVIWFVFFRVLCLAFFWIILELWKKIPATSSKMYADDAIYNESDSMAEKNRKMSMEIKRERKDTTGGVKVNKSAILWGDDKNVHVRVNK